MPHLTPHLKAKQSLEEKFSWLRESGSYATLHLTAFGKKMTVVPNLFVNLACWLHDVYGFKILVVGNERHHPSWGHFSEVLGGEPWVVDTVSQLDLAEMAWLLKMSSITVGRDSGLTHISAAMGTATFTIVISIGKNTSIETLASVRA